MELPELGLEAEPLDEPDPEAPLLDWSVEDEDALPLGDELGAALEEDDEPPLGEVLGAAEELELELGLLGVLMLPEAEPLAEPGRLLVSAVDDPDEDELEPDGGVADPLELLLSGLRSQP